VGYSGKALAEKLGLKPGTTVHVVGNPDDYAARLEPLPQGALLRYHFDPAELLNRSLRDGLRARLDFVHCFVRTRAELLQAAPVLAQVLAPGGILWVSWPKLAAARKLGLPGDISEETLRELLLPTGLVDVKVCAVSEVWSGLKFLWRRAG
jgi:hypothetical protein